MRTTATGEMERVQSDLRAMLHHGVSRAGQNGDGSFHCFNKVGDAVFDLTSEQFDHPIEYRLDIPQKREIHFAKAEKKARYEALKGMLIRMGRR